MTRTMPQSTGTTRELDPQKPSDATIARLVVDELYWDSRLDVSKIKVEVTDGVVTLSGNVPTLTDAYSAESDTRMIRGVITVNNQLQVLRPSVIPDTELQSNINAVLTWDPDVDNSDIEVTVHGGTVTLKGTVPKYWDKLRAHLLARGVRGTVAVVDELIVTPKPNIADHEIARTLTAALERRLADGFSLVQVTVEDGRVTLRGSVPDWTAYHRTAEAAEITAGVTDITNELRIQEHYRT